MAGRVFGHKTVTTTYNEYLGGGRYFSEEVGDVKVNQTLKLASLNETYYVTTSFNEKTNSTYIGVQYTPLFKANTEFFLGSLIPLLTMIWIFSFAVGLFNILPIYPLDGGLMVEAVAESLSKKHAKRITMLITYIMVIAIFYSFVGPSLPRI